jgi:hypothetical protein
MRVVLDLLGKSIRQPREPSSVHPYIQVRPLGELVETWSGSGLPSIRVLTAPMHSAGL